MSFFILYGTRWTHEIFLSRDAHRVSSQPARRFFSLHRSVKRDEVQARLSTLRRTLVSEQAERREHVGTYWEEKKDTSAITRSNTRTHAIGSRPFDVQDGQRLSVERPWKQSSTMQYERDAVTKYIDCSSFSVARALEYAIGIFALAWGRNWKEYRRT